MTSAIIEGQARFALITIPGVAASVAGAILIATTPDPLRTAIVAYNEQARRGGFCSDHPRPPRPPAEPSDGPLPSRHEGLPVLPSGGWIP